MNVVYATENAIVGFDGRGIRVIKGTHWPADDPLVRARPDLFSDDARYGLFFTVEPEPAPVEKATAAPGERRNVRRG